jgi:hypothetical protein
VKREKIFKIILGQLVKRLMINTIDSGICQAAGFIIGDIQFSGYISKTLEAEVLC